MAAGAMRETFQKKQSGDEQNPASPGPKGKPFVGCFFELRRDPLKFSLRLGVDYGEIDGATASAANDSFSASEPSYQWTPSGWHKLAIFSTQAMISAFCVL